MMLEGAHAVVTGGGTGTGAAIAEALAHAGAKVTVLGRREAPLREVAKQHKFIGWVTCDVTDPQAVRTAFRQARELNGPVGVVVANAGAADSTPFRKMSAEGFQQMLDVNLKGVFNSFQAGLADMETAGAGRLIAIASTAGLKGYPYVAGYCAAKHGVVGLIRALAVELGRTGVTANAICPGFIETPMLDRSIANIVDKTGLSAEAAAKSLRKGNPQDRFIQVDEVAGAVLWLCSQAARSVNGHALALSGGEI
ncbi:D-beta-hydroxybutyrate dehydrogenase (plasmid) [Ruegeria pomeroyi DSS-3]|uniref:D-beta-hydroxybutyrate dehydrogenase, putative n=2 Tax=Ruegeria pomeroyi TaxID=89184 RepID=Q5LKH5_RUEPO|nr:SDR family NAD(P)-dependent oxidoreductase [Ruegeria pomeroyi]AAV97537.1 D-beta-hydroxybutyrate dehydrogenase [Ruegeria pomeroyi DSS-3]NVK97872.1 SDR family oxidoreductase [Ruegeria pomeroyi]NVL01398.1 SDR family oxidoreductase [Ruegeria pomeroyi]